VLQVLTSNCIPNHFCIFEILLNFCTNSAADCDEECWSDSQVMAYLVEFWNIVPTPSKRMRRGNGLLDGLQ
jgi:hypothetical protein